MSSKYPEEALTHGYLNDLNKCVFSWCKAVLANATLPYKVYGQNLVCKIWTPDWWTEKSDEEIFGNESVLEIEHKYLRVMLTIHFTAGKLTIMLKTKLRSKIIWILK